MYYNDLNIRTTLIIKLKMSTFEEAAFVTKTTLTLRVHTTA